MEKFLKCMFSVIIAYIVLYGLNSVLRISSFILTIIICIGSVYLINYLWQSESVIERTDKVECIVNLTTKAIGEEFLHSKYAGYKKISGDSNGNDYLSPSGAVLCTRYVEKKHQVKVKGFNFATHVLCIAIGIWAIIGWKAIFPTGIVQNKIVYLRGYTIRNILNELVIGWNYLVTRININIKSLRHLYALRNIEENFNTILNICQITLTQIFNNISNFIADLQNVI